MDTQSKISLFPPFRMGKSNIPKAAITIEDFCGNVIDEEYRDKITQIRKEQNPLKQKELKSNLPTVTISGLFSQAKNECLIKHSGFIAIDIDGQDNPKISDWSAFRDTLGTWNEILFCALSVRGNGVFAIVPILFPDKHALHYEAISRDFEKLGVKIDTKCKNVSRLRFISSDGQATWNPKAKPYRKIFNVNEPLPKISRFGQYNQNSKDDNRIPKLAEWVNIKHGQFSVGNRNQWITQFAAAGNRIGIDQSAISNYCMHMVQTDFSIDEINRTICCIYRNKRWSN
jgi:hypothetical protein